MKKKWVANFDLNCIGFGIDSWVHMSSGTDSGPDRLLPCKCAIYRIQSTLVCKQSTDTFQVKWNKKFAVVWIIFSFPIVQSVTQILVIIIFQFF